MCTKDYSLDQGPLSFVTAISGQSNRVNRAIILDILRINNSTKEQFSVLSINDVLSDHFGLVLSWLPGVGDDHRGKPDLEQDDPEQLGEGGGEEGELDAGDLGGGLGQHEGQADRFGEKS